VSKNRTKGFNLRRKLPAASQTICYDLELTPPFRVLARYGWFS